MLRARNKKISLVLVLAMLMTMFVGLGTASAATNYSATIAPTLQQGVTNVGVGQLVVDWDVISGAPGAGTDHTALIVLPSGFTFNAPGAAGAVIPGAAAITKQTLAAGTVVTPQVQWLSNKEIKLIVNVAGTPPAPGSATGLQVVVNIPNVDVAADAPVGAAELNIANVAGLFPVGKATVANVSGGMVKISVLDTKTFNDGVAQTVEFTIFEDSKLALADEDNTLKFKLPKGWEFDLAVPAAATILDANTNGAPVGTNGVSPVFKAPTVSTDKRTLYVHRNNLTNVGGVDVTPGKGIFKLQVGVKVDGIEAEPGDCTVDISGKTSIANSSVSIGSYADYGYTIKVDNPDKEIIAGRGGEDATISLVRIKENIGGSLLPNRTILFTLPDGVEWEFPVAPNTRVNATSVSNTMNFNSAAFVPNKPNVLKVVLANGAPANKGEMKFDAEVRVAADFEGPITVECSGSAGVNETITVGKVVKGLTASADPIDVKIGMQDQKAADIVIKESKPGVLISQGAPNLTITAPAGVSFSKLPSVKVEGDLTIGTVGRAIGADGTRNNIVTIPIRSASSKTAATITVSGIYYSVDRTVPEGDMKLTVSGAAINEAAIANRGVAVSVKAANVVTPAPADTKGNGQFRIDSNIYYVGGAAKVMDVAPYIKADRTYVPMRYLGEILGAEVVWDDAAKTVTLTKGDTIAVFTIGQTAYTVNGETSTADVAPEITKDRTMLPARYVAEAFGAVVGWDAAARTVIIQN